MPTLIALTGTPTLLRASLKHEARSLAPWIAIVTVLTVSSVIVYPWLFPDAVDRKTFATTVGGNPALGLIFGPAHDLSSVDGFNAWRSLALGGFVTALGMIFTVTKASRGQEDSGQAELLASGVLGRQARLLSAVALAAVGSVAVGVMSAALTLACGGGWADTLVLSAGFTVTGLMFASVAALSAQISSEARTANTVAVSVLGAFFVLRGFLYSVDAPGWTTWINPLGWISETRPASGNHWWPLLLGVLFACLVTVAAFRLQAARDFGQGFIAPGAGPARGTIGTPFGLALRLNRAAIISWACAFIGLGVILGYFTRSADDMLTDNPAMADIFAAGAASPADLIGAFVTTLMSLVGIIASVSGVQIINRIRTEELTDRAEPVLATAVTRHRYLAAGVLLAVVSPAVSLMIAGTVVGIFADSAQIPIDFTDALLQAAATVPAMWAVIAVAVAVIGARPQVQIASWAGVIASFGLTLLGPSFTLPDWALGISPFHHVPDMSAAERQWSGLMWVGVVAAVLLVVGFTAFRRRDTP